jgi:TRAP-type C4-dicarboxylate transport system permease small subunit
MNFLASIRRQVDRATDWFAVVMFLFIFAVVMAQIFFRYFLQSPLVWSEELSRAVFIWVSLIGWVIATRNGSHIRIAFFAQRLPPRLERALAIAMRLATVAFLGILAFYGGIMAWRTLGRSLITLPAIPVGVLYLSLPVTALLGIFYNLCDMAQARRAGSAPAID